MANIEVGSDKYILIQTLIESYDLLITSAHIPVASVLWLPGKVSMAAMDIIHLLRHFDSSSGHRKVPLIFYCKYAKWRFSPNQLL